MISLNQFTAKYYGWQDYKYHVMIPLLPNKVKAIRQIFKFKNNCL